MTFAEWLSLHVPHFVDWWDWLMLADADVGKFWFAYAILCNVGLQVAVAYFVKNRIEKRLRKGRKVNHE